MKYERLFRETVEDARRPVDHIDAYRRSYNAIRPHEAIAWNRPREAHLCPTDLTIPNVERKENLPPM